MAGTVEQEIFAQEEHLTQAERSLDISALDRLYADDVLFTGVTGEVCGKAAMMGEVRQGLIQRDAAAAQGKKFAASIDQEDMKVLTQGDTAVASYRFLVHIEAEGVDVAADGQSFLVAQSTADAPQDADHLDRQLDTVVEEVA